MLAEQISRGALASRIFDVCLIGAGPAGITIATELGARGHSVLLLEAGGASYEESSQAMYSGEVVGALKFALDTSRLRYLGGASNHWGGFCQALDAVDFESKVAGIDTEWPIRRRHLDPYLERAEAIVEIPALPPDRPYGEHLRLTTMRFSPPVNFATKYRATLEKLPNVATILQACVVNLNEQGGAIVSVEVASFGS